MVPRTWYDIPAEELVKDPRWQRVNMIVLRELSHVMIQQHTPKPGTKKITLELKGHPAMSFDYVRQWEAYRLN